MWLHSVSLAFPVETQGLPSASTADAGVVLSDGQATEPAAELPTDSSFSAEKAVVEVSFVFRRLNGCN